MAPSLLRRRELDVFALYRYLRGAGHVLTSYINQATNNANLVRMLLKYDKNAKIANAVSKSRKIPLLAFAFVHGAQTSKNTLVILKILLAAKADPHSIPADMWRKHWMRPLANKRDEQEDGEQPSNDDDKAAEATSAWCTQEMRKRLAEALELGNEPRFYCDRDLLRE